MQITRRQGFTLGAAAIAVAAIPGMPKPASAAAPQSGQQAPGFYRFKVGDFEVTAIHDGVLPRKVDAAWIPNMPLAEVMKAVESNFLGTDTVSNSFTQLVVNTGAKLVLIDTGFADNGPAGVGLLAANMAAAGIDPKAIDTVIISHFHGDHISGVRNKAGALVYANAEIMVPAPEWAYWMDDGQMSRVSAGFMEGVFKNARRVFGPIAKDVKRYEWGKEIVTGISTVNAAGHTPGHTAYVLASGSGKHMVISETTNHPAIFARNPDWHLWADQDAAMAVATRRKLLDMLAAERMRVSFYHAPFPANGFIAKAGSGYEYVPAAWSSAL
ncbi:MAG: MBL fold metallo-hydrolase [Alphaproteobacteria bacterium]|nr:MBL fold metallo-hydrolase [Alphaproteobacteria bacterium]